MNKKQIVKALVVMLLSLTFLITGVVATQPSATKPVFVWNPYAMLILLSSLSILGGLLDRKRLFWIVIITNFLILTFSNSLFILSIISFSFFPSADIVSFLFCVLLIPLVFLFFLIPAVPALLGSRARSHIRIGKYEKVLVAVLIIISIAANYFALHTEIKDTEYGMVGESGFSGVVPITHNLSSRGKGVIIMQNLLNRDVSIDNIDLTLPPFMNECNISSILPISLEPKEEKRVDITCNFREDFVGVYYRVDMKIIYTENITQKGCESSGVIWGVIE